MRSPKLRFIESPFRKPFEELSAIPAFEEGLYAALLEMQCEQHDPIMPQGLDSASRMAGAKRFMEILSTLHLKEQAPPTTRFPSLVHPSMRKDT